jgi:hypothetical protein
MSAFERLPVDDGCTLKPVVGTRFSSQSYDRHWPGAYGHERLLQRCRAGKKSVRAKGCFGDPEGLLRVESRLPIERDQ